MTKKSTIIVCDISEDATKDLKIPRSLMDVVDEVFDLLENAVDHVRSIRNRQRIGKNPMSYDEFIGDQLSILKEIRDFMRISENFRDD